MENKHIELVKKYLADNDSVSQEELEKNAADAGVSAHTAWDTWKAADAAANAVFWEEAYDWDAWKADAKNILAKKQAYDAADDADVAWKAANATAWAASNAAYANAANTTKADRAAATADWVREYEDITNGK